MRWRWLFLPTLLVPAALAIACSASNGDAIPSEVRDAEALDAGAIDPTDRDSSSTTEGDSGNTNPPKDGGSKDATNGDTGTDAGQTSESVRINEIFVERSGSGAKVEYIEIRGPAGVAIDDLSIRVLDSTGTPTAANPYAVATAGQKMPASGLWVIGGFLASTDTVISIPNGWDLDTKGSVQLLRGASKTLIDVVGWTDDADAGAIPQPTSDPKTVVEGKPFVLPATGTKSFGRAATGADTNDNAKDFCNMNQSAKATNGACQ